MQTGQNEAEYTKKGSQGYFMVVTEIQGTAMGTFARKIRVQFWKGEEKVASIVEFEEIWVSRYSVFVVLGILQHVLADSKVNHAPQYHT